MDKLHFKITEKRILKRIHLTGEHDVASFYELPVEDLIDLQTLPPEELAYSLSLIIKDMALSEYLTRIDNALGQMDKDRLKYARSYGQSAIDFIANALRYTLYPVGSNERAKIWYEDYFKRYSLAYAPKLVADKSFALEFEICLRQILNTKKRIQKLSKMKAKCFFSKAKKSRIDKNILRCKSFLWDNSVGIYAILLYGFTLYSEKSSDMRLFYRCLNLKSQNKQ